MRKVCADLDKSKAVAGNFGIGKRGVRSVSVSKPETPNLRCGVFVGPCAARSRSLTPSPKPHHLHHKPHGSHPDIVALHPAVARPCFPNPQSRP